MMNRQKIEGILSRHSVITFPMYMKHFLQPETQDGVTRISAQLTTPPVDVVEGGGLKVETNIKAGGFCWPAHSVVVSSDDENMVVMAAKAAAMMALAHEYDEHATLDGKRIVDPHPGM